MLSQEKSINEALGKLVIKKVDGNRVYYWQNLEGHIEDCLKILKAYIDKNAEIIKQFCERWTLNYEHLLKNLFITVYLHDVGKLTEQFQKRIRKGKHSQEYPHAFFAVPIFFELYKQKLINPLLSSKEFTKIELCSILGHHTQLYNRIYDNINVNPMFLKKSIVEFINKIMDFYRKLTFDRHFNLKWQETSLQFDLPGRGPLFNKIKKYRNYLIQRCPEDIMKKIKQKSVYCFFHSVLKLCDDYSSANFYDFVQKYDGKKRCFGSVLRDPEKIVPILPDIKDKDILNNYEPYDFQKEIKKAPKFCLLFAPCGRGKTEASLLWAFEVCRKYKRNKIVFAMPTQVTSNAMYERLCELFGDGETRKERIKNGEKYVGLYHGKSFLEYEEKAKEVKEIIDDELSEEDLEEIRSENFKGNIFFKPVTVTTIDHLILSFVHGYRQADFALGNLQNAVIIFDEVHYYEKRTLEHLITLFKILKEMAIPNLLMSGTLPEFFVERVKQVNPLYEGPIRDLEGLTFRPFKIRVYKEPLICKNKVNDKVVKEIAKNYVEGQLNQFIILNTVKRSQRFYEELLRKLNKPNILLLHSEFVWEDKQRKEKELIKKLKEKKERPLILISTQIIEVSLDISCERMYTELAPADALGQRGGRLNRGKKNPNGSIMKVFLPEEMFTGNNRKKPYEPDLLKKTLDLLEEKEYSYTDIKKICDKIYDGMDLKGTNLMKLFAECCLFGYSPQQIAFDEERGRLLQIREEAFKKMEVIPIDVVKEKILDFYKKKEMPSMFASDSIQDLYEHFILKDKSDKLRKLIFSVRNEGKVPLYIYQKNPEQFEFFKLKSRFYRFTRIPYFKYKGFDYKEKITKQLNSKTNII